MSRSDLYGWGLTFVGSALGYLIGGPIGALLVLLLGVVLIVMANMRGGKRETEPDTGAIFGGTVPFNEAIFPRSTEEELAVISTPAPVQADLVIYRNGNVLTWMLRNRGLKPDLSFGHIHIKNARSIDAALKRPRDTLQGFSLILDTIRTLDAGECSDKRIFASVENGEVEIGGRGSGRVPWPHGDYSDIHEWIVTLWISTFRPNYIWEVELTLTWNRKENSIGIGERRISKLLED